MKIGIVVIGYNNNKSIKRLLNRLNETEYGGNNCALVISIDKSNDNKVTEIANEYEWKHGEKIIVAQEERLGLRNHVLKCGSYMERFGWDAEIVFEDDTYPAMDFFLYSKQVVEKYGQDDKIAGAGLYKFSDNRSAKYPKSFIPIEKGADVFFLQFACSWGQIWFKKSWEKFIDWYDSYDGDIKKITIIPEAVRAWDDRSWLKYHIAYCIMNNKYFVYPYIARSTCFSEEGEHTAYTSDELQIPIAYKYNRELILPSLDDEMAVHYDGFFEYQDFGDVNRIDIDDIEIDLNGTKRFSEKRYLLTPLKTRYHVVCSWANHLIPSEMNIISNLAGEGIFLYDLGIDKKTSLPAEKSKADKYLEYFDILDAWMNLRKMGISVSSYFERKGIKTVAIYGMGRIAKHLIDDLHDSSVLVAYGIESKKCEQRYGIDVHSIYDELEPVDVVVVTPMFDFENISELLKSKKIYAIESIRDIVLEASMG